LPVTAAQRTIRGINADDVVGHGEEKFVITPALIPAFSLEEKENCIPPPALSSTGFATLPLNSQRRQCSFPLPGGEG
jgi:hypothetical protein